MMDVNNLKLCNDTLGHDFGDALLMNSASLIKKAFPIGECLRMGGDEFEAVLILSEPGRVGKFIRHVRANIREINLAEKYPFELSASIGTCDVTDWQTLAEAMKQADKAMYLEKNAKKKNS